MDKLTDEQMQQFGGAPVGSGVKTTAQMSDAQMQALISSGSAQPVGAGNGTERQNLPWSQNTDGTFTWKVAPNEVQNPSILKSAVRPLVNTATAPLKTGENLARIPADVTDLAKTQGFGKFDMENGISGGIGGAGLELVKNVSGYNMAKGLGDIVLGGIKAGVDKLTGVQSEQNDQSRAFANAKDMFTDTNAYDVVQPDGTVKKQNLTNQPIPKIVQAISESIYKLGQEDPMVIPIIAQSLANPKSASANPFTQAKNLVNAKNDVISMAAKPVTYPIEKTISLAEQPIQSWAMNKRIEEFQRAFNQSKGLVQTENTYGKDSPKFAAELEREGVKLPMTTDARGRADWSEAIKNVDGVASRDNAALRKLLESSGTNVDLDQALADAKANAISQYKGTARDIALNHLDEEFAAYKQQLSDVGFKDSAGHFNVPTQFANDIKQDLWSKSKFPPLGSPTDQVAAGSNFLGGHTLKNSIEEAVNKVGGDDLVSRLNERLGNLQSLSTTLDKANGGAVHGLFSGRLAGRIVGAVAGLPSGGMSSFAGAVTGDMIAEALANPENTISRYILARAENEQPTILAEVEKQIGINAESILSRKMLPAPRYMEGQSYKGNPQQSEMIVSRGEVPPSSYNEALNQKYGYRGSLNQDTTASTNSNVPSGGNARQANAMTTNSVTNSSIDDSIPHPQDMSIVDKIKNTPNKEGGFINLAGDSSKDGSGEVLNVDKILGTGNPAKELEGMKQANPVLFKQAINSPNAEAFIQKVTGSSDASVPTLNAYYNEVNSLKGTVDVKDFIPSQFSGGFADTKNTVNMYDAYIKSGDFSASSVYQDIPSKIFNVDIAKQIISNEVSKWSKLGLPTEALKASLNPSALTPTGVIDSVKHFINSVVGAKTADAMANPNTANVLDPYGRVQKEIIDPAKRELTKDPSTQAWLKLVPTPEEQKKLDSYGRIPALDNAFKVLPDLIGSIFTKTGKTIDQKATQFYNLVNAIGGSVDKNVLKPLINSMAKKAEALTIYSDSNTTVNGGQPAVPTYAGHIDWTADIPGGTWIGKDYFSKNPSQDTYTTYLRKFYYNPDPKDPVSNLHPLLTVAADNSYDIWINGKKTNLGDPGEFNYEKENTKYIDLAPYLEKGKENSILFDVKNWAQEKPYYMTDDQWNNYYGGYINPSGLLYRLDIPGASNITPKPEPEPNPNPNPNPNPTPNPNPNPNPTPNPKPTPNPNPNPTPIPINRQRNMKWMEF